MELDLTLCKICKTTKNVSLVEDSSGFRVECDNAKKHANRFLATAPYIAWEEAQEAWNAGILL